MVAPKRVSPKNLEQRRMKSFTVKTVLLFFVGPNRTAKFRKAISCHYAGSDCHYIDVKGTTQQSIADEVEAIAKKRGITDLSFQDIWHMRSRCVRGTEGKL